MKKTEKLIPIAMKAVEKFIVIDISSFGASVIQSGLLPTLAFYSDAKKSEGNRSLLIPAMMDVMFESESYPVNENVKKLLETISNNKEKLPEEMHLLFAWLLENNRQNPEKLKKELMDSSIAIKLALRTFKEKTDKNDKP